LYQAAQWITEKTMKLDTV